MRVEIVMPKLADSMTEGAVVAWLKNEGEAVTKGEAIAEIETEKSTVDLEAPAAGVLSRIAVAAGTEHVAVGTLLAAIETAVAGEHAGAARGADGEAELAPGVQGGGGETASPGEGSVVVASRESVTASATAGAATVAPVAAPSTLYERNGHQSSEMEIAATPLARRMAVQAGIVLSSLKPSGIGGKVCKADVESAIRCRNGSPEERPRASTTTTARPAQRDAAARPSRMRRSIGERMSRAKQTIPHFYLSVDCRVDRLLKIRKRINGDGGIKVSLNDFVVRAAALALRRIPAANACWGEDGPQQQQQIDIAVAVALDDGLVTPIVRGADGLGLGAISAAVADLATRARSGDLQPHEYDGGTFTVSNLGMFGVGTMYAIINPPQACILGVGAAEQKPVVSDGTLEVGTVMTLSLSADHRIIDGAIGARLLAEIRRLLEEPARMLL